MVHNSDWHKTNYRRCLVDMHIDDWHPDFMSRFDPKVYVENLRKADVSCAMVYANSHVGLSYWPTKTGRMHANLHGRDIFGEIERLCHESGMDFILYYSVIYNNWAYDHHPEWRIIDAEGRSSREGAAGTLSGRYGQCCPNAPGYREFIAAQLEELAQSYRFESVFFDMTFWPSVCYCPHCRSRWQAETGESHDFPPRKLDWNDPRWVLFQEKRERWLHEFAMFATDTIKKLKPGVTANHQYSTILAGSSLGVAEDHTDACDYVGGDFYGGITQQGLVCKLFGSLAGSFEFHTSRCVNLFDHISTKSPVELEIQSCVALAHKGAFLFIDAIDPVGTLNPAVYERMGDIFGKFKRYEPYLGGELMADVAVLFDANAKPDPLQNGKKVTEYTSWTCPMTALISTVCTNLKEAHIPYTVIGVRNLKNAIEKYRVIVLSDLVRLSNAAAALLREYVRQGGAVYASGASGLGQLDDVFGFTLLGETEGDRTFFAPTEAGKALFLEQNPQYPLSLKRRQKHVRSLPSAIALATVALPYDAQNVPGGFASIHSDPPGQNTDSPALLENHFGQGRTVWAAGVIEESKDWMHRQTFANIILYLLDGNTCHHLNAPPAVEAVCFAQTDGVLVNLLNAQELLPPVPVYGMEMTVQTPGKQAQKVLLLPEERELPFRQAGDAVTFDVPPLELYHMIKIVTEAE
ncbi:MAG: alpha-L-fucosidase [Oscillospiraceae bacterium]|jgi:hypothetical protein|nr:alpha-L-fucosidase [Oscillospiraceae bacterium]